MSHLSILFMGTPDFAEASLRALCEAGEKVVGVVTGEDKRTGRGMRLTYSEVKTYALSQNLPVFQPASLKDGAVAPLLKELCPDIIVVVAYGKILPEYVLCAPKYGCINIHGSLLPRYRGAAPIQRAVLNGEKVTGVTSMHMAKGLDTGDIIFSEETPIGENESVGELWDRLSVLGGKVLLRTLDALEAGTAPRTAQNDADATYAAKITKEETLLDFTKPAAVVHNTIRGMSPFPAAYAYLNGIPTKLYDSFVCDGNGTPGEILSLSPDGVCIACGTGAVKVFSFKPEGCRRMSASDMINGRKITKTARFTATASPNVSSDGTANAVSSAE